MAEGTMYKAKQFTKDECSRMESISRAERLKHDVEKLLLDLNKHIEVLKEKE